MVVQFSQPYQCTFSFLKRPPYIQCTALTKHTLLYSKTRVTRQGHCRLLRIYYIYIQPRFTGFDAGMYVQPHTDTDRHMCMYLLENHKDRQMGITVAELGRKWVSMEAHYKLAC